MLGYDFYKIYEHVKSVLPPILPCVHTLTFTPAIVNPNPKYNVQTMP